MIIDIERFNSIRMFWRGYGVLVEILMVFCAKSAQKENGKSVYNSHFIKREKNIFGEVLQLQSQTDSLFAYDVSERRLKIQMTRRFYLHALLAIAQLGIMQKLAVIHWFIKIRKENILRGFRIRY